MTAPSVTALAVGAAIVARTSPKALAFGEMGIGNTASASLLAHKLSGLPLEGLVGRGTGCRCAGLAQARYAVPGRRALQGPPGCGHGWPNMPGSRWR